MLIGRSTWISHIIVSLRWKWWKRRGSDRYLGACRWIIHIGGIPRSAEAHRQCVHQRFLIPIFHPVCRSSMCGVSQLTGWRRCRWETHGLNFLQLFYEVRGSGMIDWRKRQKWTVIYDLCAEIGDLIPPKTSTVQCTKFLSRKMTLTELRRNVPPATSSRLGQVSRSLQTTRIGATNEFLSSEFHYYLYSTLSA